MSLANITLSEMADGTTINLMSLHSGNPGAAGTDNEVSGNGYTRQACTFSAASNGVRPLSAQVDFVGPPLDPVLYVGLWESDGPVFKGSEEVTGDQSFNAAGEYSVTTASQIAVVNPA